jgi:hypothetical protein
MYSRGMLLMKAGKKVYAERYHEEVSKRGENELIPETSFFFLHVVTLTKSKVTNKCQLTIEMPGIVRCNHLQAF